MCGVFSPTGGEGVLQSTTFRNADSSIYVIVHSTDDASHPQNFPGLETAHILQRCFFLFSVRQLYCTRERLEIADNRSRVRVLCIQHTYKSIRTSERVAAFARPRGRRIFRQLPVYTEMEKGKGPPIRHR